MRALACSGIAGTLKPGLTQEAAPSKDAESMRGAPAPQHCAAAAAQASKNRAVQLPAASMPDEEKGRLTDEWES